MSKPQSHRTAKMSFDTKPVKPELLVKDRKYFNDATKNGFSWNNKHRIRGKCYSFFHEYNDKFLPTLQKIEKEELETQKFQEKARIERLAENRADILKSFNERAQVRTLIQIKSNQDLRNKEQLLTAEEVDKMIINYEKDLAKKAIRAKHTIHTDNKWNFHLEHDKKRADLLVLPLTVRAEENLVANVQRKLRSEQDVEAQYDKIKQAQTQNYQKKYSKNRSSLELLSLSGKKHGGSQDRVESTSTLNDIKNSDNSGIGSFSHLIGSNPFSPGSGSFISNNDGIINAYTLPVDKIVPPRKTKYLPKNDLERPEFKGLMLKNCNEGVSERMVPMVSALTSRSPLFWQIHSVAKSSHKGDLRLNITTERGNITMNVISNPKDLTLQLNEEVRIPVSTREIKADTYVKPIKSRVALTKILKSDLENPKEALAELERFEEKCYRPSKYEGFPRSELGLTVI